MKIGVVGLDRIGLCVALAFESRGHVIYGYDFDNIGNALQILNDRQSPPAFAEEERLMVELLSDTKIQLVVLAELVSMSDLIVVVFDNCLIIADNGIADYSIIESSLLRINKYHQELLNPIPVLLMSTVAPGTMATKLVPLMKHCDWLAYQPHFITKYGNVIRDILQPDLILLGTDNDELYRICKRFWSSISNNCSNLLYRTDLVSAEMVKLCHSSFLLTKLSYRNAIQEMCHRLGGNIDHVCEALFSSRGLLTTDLGSSVDNGVKDHQSSGRCSSDGNNSIGRDSALLAGVSKNCGMIQKYFQSIAHNQQELCQWYADLIASFVLPKIILGRADDRRLLAIKTILEKNDFPVLTYDPLSLSSTTTNNNDDNQTQQQQQSSAAVNKFVDSSVFFIATPDHRMISAFDFPSGSIIIDPWHIVSQQSDVSVIHVGKQHI